GLAAAGPPGEVRRLLRLVPAGEDPGGGVIRRRAAAGPGTRTSHAAGCVGPPGGRLRDLDPGRAVLQHPEYLILTLVGSPRRSPTGSTTRPASGSATCRSPRTSCCSAARRRPEKMKPGMAFGGQWAAPLDGLGLGANGRVPRCFPLRVWLRYPAGDVTRSAQRTGPESRVKTNSVPRSGHLPRRLPGSPHGSVPLLEVGDAVLLPVAQPHHVELPHAVALRPVEHPLTVPRRRRVVVHRPRRRLGQLLALAVEGHTEQLDVAPHLGGVEDR